jgi:SAM-dependent methyltransferase
MKAFWDERYNSREYVYGIEPNDFFRKALNDYAIKGNILLPAEGEGRNAVFAAKSGLSVTAFDISKYGREKALRLAEENHVNINYLLGDLDAQDFKESSFDVLALIYAHFPAAVKSAYLAKLSQYLKPGGMVIFEAFSKNHLEYSRINPAAGGPKDLDVLYSVDEIKRDFAGFEILLLKEEILDLSEGKFHKGKSAVIRFIGRKPLKSV